jgi:DNA repair protein RecO (recombination protein O)
VVVLWTRHHGKVRVLAKGVRKTSSRMGGSLETLGYVTVDLVKTRGEFFIARHVQHKARLATLRSTYARISAGYAVVEAVDAIPSDGVPDEAIFDLLVRVLVTLDDESFHPTLVPASFFFRLLALDGSEPVVDACVNCGRSGPLVAFDAQIGGTLCDECRQGVAISSDALALIRRVMGGDLANVLRDENPPGAGEVTAVAQEAIEVHFGKRLRAPQASAPLKNH